MAPTCPYCTASIANTALGTHKCKKCKQKIFVYGLKDRTNKVFLTDAQARDFDTAKAAKYKEDQSEKLIHELLDEIQIRKGTKPSRIASATAKYEKLTDWNEKEQIASRLAACAYADNLNPQQWEIETAVCQLEKIRVIPSWHNHLFISIGCAGTDCAELEDRKFTLAQAFAEMPIPSRRCNNDRNLAGFARCQCSWMVDLDTVRLMREK